MKKRALSLFLAACIVFAMLPTTAIAAEGMALTIEKINIDAAGESVTVNMNVSNAEAFMAMGVQLNYDTSVLELKNVAFGEALAGTSGTLTPNYNDCSWNADWGNDVTPADGVAFVLTFTVAEGASGEYTISACLSDAGCANSNLEDVEPTFVDGSITVGSAGEGGDEPTDPGESTDPNPDETVEPEIDTTVSYTANLSTEYSAVKVGDTVTVDVQVGGTTKEFASSELLLSYTGLTYDATNSIINGASVTANGGTIQIIDHGESTSWGEGEQKTAYTLSFTVDSLNGAPSGTASVDLDYAAFGTQANASGANLGEANVTIDTKEFFVTPADLEVKLPTGFTGDDTVVYDGTYTFEADNKHYNYVIAVNGNEGVAVETATGSGVWEITGVTSDLVITEISKNAKTYTITFSDHTHIKNQENATVNFVYGTEGGFSFVLKDDVAPSTKEGTQYVVNSIKYTGTENAVTHTPPAEGVTTDRTYTIATEEITGNITITTSANPVAPNQFTVTLPSNYPELTVDKEVVDKNGSVVLTLNPVAGYKYTVSVNGTAIPDSAWIETEETGDDSLTYTISNITANVTVTVVKSVDASQFTVTIKDNYVAMDSKHVYLVRVKATLDAGYTCTYDGNAMYWSEGYDAEGEYVYLVITDANATLEEATVKAALNVVAGTVKATITYDGNVNLADENTVDANDAQLVWNMYKGNVYDAFANNVTGATMEKYLRADVKKNGVVDTEDAAEIIATIIASKASN